MSASYRRGRFQKQRTVAEWKARALKQIERLKAAGKEIQPIELSGRTIARSFWAKAWCENLEAWADFENRLPRGRSYVRHNSVLHLEVLAPAPESGRPTGRIHALVDGKRIFEVTLKVVPLSEDCWQEIKDASAGEIDSLLELLKGEISEPVMEAVMSAQNGIFPTAEEVDLNCTCPDWAKMCKHVSAALYGLGSRLDSHPELIFKLRGVNPKDLLAEAIEHNAARPAATGHPTLSQTELTEVFGEEVDFGSWEAPEAKSSKSIRRAPTAPKRGAPLPSFPPRVNRLLSLIKEQPGLRTPALIRGIRSKRYATTKALGILKQHGLVEFRRGEGRGGFFAIPRDEN